MRYIPRLEVIMTDAEDLEAASEAGQWLVLFLPDDGGVRLVAHVFSMPEGEGIIFLDAGWERAQDAGDQPLHLLQGQVRRAGDGWLFHRTDGSGGTFTFVPLTPELQRELHLPPAPDPGPRTRARQLADWLAGPR